jgi:putative ABC transport system ATP-binding protein
LANPVIKTVDVTKIYKLDGVEVPALRGVSFKVEPGEFVSIMGASGSGKSTLLNLLGCLDRPTSGKVEIDGEDTTRLSDNRLAYLRNLKIGFIFQTFNLLPRLTALSNVELPLIYAGVSAQERRKRAEEALKSVGLEDRMRHHPNQLSGGQQQRVAIARAVITNPRIILADEPTGNLDSHSGKEILKILQALNQRGATVLLVTHEGYVAQHAQRVIKIHDGQVVADEVSHQPRCPGEAS